MRETPKKKPVKGLVCPNWEWRNCIETTMTAWYLRMTGRSGFDIDSESSAANSGNRQLRQPKSPATGISGNPDKSFHAVNRYTWRGMMIFPGGVRGYRPDNVK
ncbi:hypothetical protein ACFL5L_00445 [candidate division KSB1 bacterium]